MDTDTDRVRKYLDDIKSLGVHAGEIVHKVLQFARPTTRAKGAICLADAVIEAVDLIRTRVPPSISLGITVADDSAGLVRIGDTEITQIMTNLVLNAVYAIAEGGAINISVAAITVEHTAADAAIMSPGRYLRFIVADTGCGMDEATRRRVFDPFFSTKPVGEGTGLGLSVVYGIVTAIKGVITVDSEVGKGTVFSVFLPEAVSDNEGVEDGTGSTC